MEAIDFAAKDQAPKEKFFVALIACLIPTAFFAIAYQFIYNNYFVWVLSLIMSLYRIGGPYVISLYVFPN